MPASPDRGSPLKRRESTDATIPRRLTRKLLLDGALQLGRRDPDLNSILTRLGPPPLWGRPPGFQTLVRIILEQQVSLAAAKTIFKRLESHLGTVTPKTVYGTSQEDLRSTGLTRQKAAYCHGLAGSILAGSLDLAKLARAEDPIRREALLGVKGLGPWSVDVYDMMALRRPDIWPTGDLALAAALMEIKRLRALPDRETQSRLSSPWSPFRSVAARILWTHYLHNRGLYTPRSSPSR